jgi:DNA-directed RNA polymerase subunit H (RpoH/RPB5)
MIDVNNNTDPNLPGIQAADPDLPGIQAADPDLPGIQAADTDLPGIQAADPINVFAGGNVELSDTSEGQPVHLSNAPMDSNDISERNRSMHGHI